MTEERFIQKYGPWVLVAGGSDGLGGAWSEAFAKRGLNVALVARRREPLEAKAKELEARYKVDTLTISLDLSSASAADELSEGLSGVELGSVVYNAALSPGGIFDKTPKDALLGALITNVVTPTSLLRNLLPRLLERDHSAVVLVSSLAGYAGSSSLATYGATKAYLRMLGEALWEENRATGLDVLVTSPGAVTTPGLIARSAKKIPGQLSPDAIVELSLSHLGKSPTFVPGIVNQLAATLLGRVLPRSSATSLMRKSSSGIAN